MVSHKFSIPYHPQLSRVSDALGNIVFCFRSFSSYALRVAILLQITFHSDWGATPFPISSALIIPIYIPTSIGTANVVL
jgi:hypothetical protein